MLKHNLADNGSQESNDIDSEVMEAVAKIEGESWMQNLIDSDAAITPNERTSLSALISYVAHNSGEHEFRIERRLSDRFNIPNVNFLPSTHYDSAIRYLVDSFDAVSA